INLAKHAAKQLNTVVVMTGPTDYITDGKTSFEVFNGHKLLTSVTGTGCLLSSIIAAFCSQYEDKVTASTAAVIFYG
ncbi:hydroxyethylthiazole kinase, partial [Pseudomonas sp. 2822-17]|uniref:hydroxyethylthiazole kinase n=1 Tax=Pseudomonas sp. 2822-17 TaxID=1712678 RepID=UPI0015AA4AF4